MENINKSTGLIDFDPATTLDESLLRPMLATLADQPFNDPQWEFEIKWDGYRTLALLKADATDLLSRNDKSYNDKFFPIQHTLRKWDLDAVLDGEIVVIDSQGRSNFSALQNWRSNQDGELIYYVFDLLSYNGKDLTHLPLSERRNLLRLIIPADDPMVKLSTSLKLSGTESFAYAQANALEGIIAKRKDSQYLPGKRSHEWLKIKVKKRQEVLIAGYTVNPESPRIFSALVLGIYNQHKLHFIGKVGTGFSEKSAAEIMTQLLPLTTDKNPFNAELGQAWPPELKKLSADKSTFWLTPDLICEIEYSEITREGFFRHPSFKGMRIDKDPLSVQKEEENSAFEILNEIDNES